MDNIKQYIEKHIKLDDICENITSYTNCDTNYIDDIFTEIVDSNIDFCYSSLINWLIDCSQASEYIEQAVKEFGIDTQNFDFTRLIQQGQYQHNYDILNENRHDILLLWCLQYCLDNNIELTDEQIDKLADCDFVNCSEFERFTDLIDTINGIKNDDN